jgi:hypothetical protein
MSVSDKELIAIQDVTTAKEAWDRIKQAHKVEGTPGELMLLNRLAPRSASDSTRRRNSSPCSPSRTTQVARNVRKTPSTHAGGFPPKQP